MVDESPEFRREIVLQSVSFCYPNTLTLALDRVSLAIPRGGRVAIVGRSYGLPEAGAGSCFGVDHAFPPFVLRTYHADKQIPWFAHFESFAYAPAKL